MACRPNYNATAKETDPIEPRGSLLLGIVKLRAADAANDCLEKREASEGIEPPYKDLQSSA